MARLPHQIQGLRPLRRPTSAVGPESRLMRKSKTRHPPNPRPWSSRAIKSSRSATPCFLGMQARSRGEERCDRATVVPYETKACQYSFMKLWYQVPHLRFVHYHDWPIYGAPFLQPIILGGETGPFATLIGVSITVPNRARDR